ncbi:hypothetical protein BDU57DRAFT_457153, partial [Ampelomyces quisqualis]
TSVNTHVKQPTPEMHPNPSSPLCRDWVFLNNANVHVAKDRGWFKTYTPFTSMINASPFMDPPQHLPVLGIGTVEIPTKRSPNTSGVSSHGTLLLHEVLHVPDILCNIIGQPLMFTNAYYYTIYGTKSRGTIKDKKGKNVAYFDPKSPLFAIKLRRPANGPSLGPHTLKRNRVYMLGCRWDESENRKWQNFKGGNGLVAAVRYVAPYSAEEKAFLKKYYGSEWHFLLQHGLRIHKEEDREDGRAILRDIMREDKMSDGEQSDDHENGCNESEFEGHQADYNFTHRQLDWIETNYRNSEQFMISHGLRFYDNEDLQEAKAIVEAMMHEDDSSAGP